jgi:hypothetical protein
MGIKLFLQTVVVGNLLHLFHQKVVQIVNLIF